MSRRNFKYGWLPRGRGRHRDSDLGRKGLFWAMFWEIQRIVGKAYSLGQLAFARNVRQQLVHILTYPKAEISVWKQGHL